MQGVTGCTSIPARVPGCPADLFANFNVKYAGQAHPVMQLNTKTASRNYSCCLAGSQRKPFKKWLKSGVESKGRVSEEFELSGFYCISDLNCVNMASVSVYAKCVLGAKTLTLLTLDSG